MLQNKKLEIAYFVDNNPKREKELFLHKKICNPLDLLYENPAEIFILLAVSEPKEAASRLVEMGFEEGRHFFILRSFWKIVIWAGIKNAIT